MVDATLRDRLLANRPALVEVWFRAIAATSFTPRPLAEVRTRLDQLFRDAVEVLAGDEFQPELARPIGATLVDLHYLNATTAAATVRLLGLQLANQLAPEEAVALQPRIFGLVAEVIAGYYAASREAILKEQDEMRDALFVTRQQADAAHEARILAETSARARSDLLGHVAHDLRSPLTSIKGQADLLAQRLRRETPPAEWIKARANLICQAADRMHNMIGELLDASRLQVGEQLELSLRRVSIQQVVGDVVQREMAGRGIQLDLEEDPIYAMLDTARFDRVLQNLLSNAFKFSKPERPVEVRVVASERGALISVRDYGIGIPAEELRKITTPFYRASTATGVPGTGLGLAGVKAIVEQHGGTLSIASTEGEGTTVTIQIPV